MDRGELTKSRDAARELLFVLTERPPSLRTRGVCCGPVILTLFTGQLYVPVTGEPPCLACVTYKCLALSPPRSLPDNSTSSMLRAFHKYESTTQLLVLGDVLSNRKLIVQLMIHSLENLSDSTEHLFTQF